MDLSIVILAAGQGTRMKSPLPKVLHPIGGKPMLAHVIATAKQLSPQQIIVVYGYAGDALKEQFKGEAVTWAHQPQQLGTGDAVAKALPFIPLDHQVLILYGDVPLITKATLKRLLAVTPADKIGLLTTVTSNPTGLGRIVRTEKGALSYIVEERDATDQERKIQEVNTGVFVVNAAHLQRWLSQLTNDNQQNEYYLTDIVKMAVKEQVAIVTQNPDAIEETQGINDRVQQATLERYYQRTRAEQLLRQGVTICDPARFDVRGEITAHPDVFIDINVVLEGTVSLGQRTRIGPHCVLINCEIDADVTVLAHSYLEGVKIGPGAVVGPFARLRPGTVLGENVRIGNFVEIKNASIGIGSKISHLSYIGDTQMGNNVNIGAGTITCNYDGVNKYQTIIEDNVSVGADSQLIAPVRVGKGAILGAGTTLTQDAPPGQLTLTHRLAYRSHPWQPPAKDPLANE